MTQEVGWPKPGLYSDSPTCHSFDHCIAAGVFDLQYNNFLSHFLLSVSVLRARIYSQRCLILTLLVQPAQNLLLCLVCVEALEAAPDIIPTAQPPPLPQPRPRRQRITADTTAGIMGPAIMPQPPQHPSTTARRQRHQPIVTAVMLPLATKSLEP